MIFKIIVTNVKHFLCCFEAAKITLAQRAQWRIRAARSDTRTKFILVLTSCFLFTSLVIVHSKATLWMIIITIWTPLITSGVTRLFTNT